MMARSMGCVIVLEPAGEDVGGHPRQPCTKRAEAFRPQHQFTQHQQRPAVADQVERVGGEGATAALTYWSVKLTDAGTAALDDLSRDDERFAWVESAVSAATTGSGAERVSTSGGSPLGPGRQSFTA